MRDQQPDGDLHLEIDDTRELADRVATGASQPSLARVQPARGRWAVRLSIAAALALAAAALLRTAASVPPIPGTPTPTPVPDGPVVLLSNVSYGSVTLNGKQLQGPPPMVMTFRPGTNVLTLAAPPFFTQTCRINWPSAQVNAGQCSTDRSRLDYTIRGQAVVPVLVVTLSLGALDLPSGPRAAAATAAAAVVSTAEIRSSVPAGNYIATGRDSNGRSTWQQTAVPLQADLLFTLDSVQTPSSDGLCDRYCAERITPDVAGTLVEHTWVADIIVAIQWVFMSGGVLVARSAVYPAAAVTLALTYDDVAGWQVSQAATQAINGFPLSAGLETLTACAAGANVLAPYAQQTGYGFGEESNRGAEGCELQMRSLAGTPEGTFLWRFGILLAVDAPAHAVAPDLPIAPAAEVAAVSG